MSTSHRIRMKHRFTISLLLENTNPCCELKLLLHSAVAYSSALTYLLISALSVCSQLQVPADVPTDT